MAETDSPEIKEWLKIKNEQKLKRLSGMLLNEKEINNFFESREIKPIVDMFRYNSISQKMEFSHGSIKPVMDNSATDTVTITVPAGHRYRVLFASAYEDIDAVSFWLEASIGGTAITLLLDTVLLAPAEIQTLIGSPLFVDAAANIHASYLGPLELSAGDTLTVTATGWLAGSTTYLNLIVEDIAA